jgi:hypothetical protein
MCRVAALVVLFSAGCTTSSIVPPGEVVLGTLNLVTTLVSSTCPFDIYPDGGLLARGPNQIVDGGGLSPAGLDISWTLSVSPDEDAFFLSNGTAERQGILDGGWFFLQTSASRQVCGAALLDEQLSGRFYGPPESTAPDGGCPSFFGPGLFPDGGIWPLALGQLSDGGLVDGGTTDAGATDVDGGSSDAGATDGGRVLPLVPSACFAPVGLLASATFIDIFTYTALPDGGGDRAECTPYGTQMLDAGLLDGGMLDGGPFPPICQANYSMNGSISP